MFNIKLQNGFTQSVKGYKKMCATIKNYLLSNNFTHCDFIVFKGNKAIGKIWDNSRTLRFEVTEIIK